MGVFTVLYSIRDGKSKSSLTEMNIPDTLSVAAAIEFAQNMAVLIDAMITGQIYRVGVGLVVDLPGGLKSSPGANSDVEEGAKFQFQTAGNFYTSMRLPTFDETLISAGGSTVDTEDADVAAFISAMTDGIEDIGVGDAEDVFPCDKREEDVQNLVWAVEQFLSSRGRTA